VAQSTKNHADALHARSLLAICHRGTAPDYGQDNPAECGRHVLRPIPHFKPVPAVSPRSVAFDLAVLEDPHRWYAHLEAAWYTITKFLTRISYLSRMGHRSPTGGSSSQQKGNVAEGGQ